MTTTSNFIGLSEVVRYFSASTTVERVRYSGGTRNATGEREGQARESITLECLVTRGRDGLVVRGFGELGEGKILVNVDARQLDDVEGDVVVGEVVLYEGREYEVVEAKVTRVRGDTLFVRYMCREVQNHGRG